MGSEPVVLIGSPPLGVCTICIGKKEIGWKNHFGIIRSLDMPDPMYRGDWWLINGIHQGKIVGLVAHRHVLILLNVLEKDQQI
jgi:hypothetical protein